MLNASDLWYVETSSQGVGPLTGDAVREELANGTISLDTLICPIGGRDWVPLKSVPQLVGPPAAVAETTLEEEEDFESAAPASAAMIAARSRRKYGFLLWAAATLDTLAAATVLLGGIALLVLAAMFVRQPRDIPDKDAIVAAAGFAYLLLGIFTTWLSLRIWAALIRLAVQLEHNTHQSAKWSRRTTAALSTSASVESSR